VNTTGIGSVDEVLVGVFEEQWPRLRGFFTRASGETAFAEDLLQETALRAWGHRGSLTGSATAAQDVRDGARRYVWRVARNLLIDEIRCRQRQRARVAVLDGAAEPRGGAAAGSIALPTPGPEEAVETAECLRIIREAVDHLANRRVRGCLQLWLGGVDIDGIAGQHNLTAGQVRGLLQRGRAEIARQAAERLGAPI